LEALELDEIGDVFKHGAKGKAREGFPPSTGTARIHVGDRVLLLDRERFALMMKNVAQKLAGMRVERMSGYVDVMGRVVDLRRFDPIPEPA
jgi:hypothetical protein